LSFTEGAGESGEAVDEDQGLLERRNGHRCGCGYGTEPPHAAETAAVAVAPRGQKPGGVVVDTAEITAKVEAIDSAKRTLTLRGPGGKSRIIKVDPSVKGFQDIKKGDEVVVRHTEAVAIAVRKP
jgi:hypothetical protein